MSAESQRIEEAKIHRLAIGYALGTDEIGNSKLAQGKEIYATCFTHDAEVTVYFPGTDPNGPPSSSTIGPNAWADFVNSVFRQNGYVATQHLIGSIQVTLNGETATMSSYLHATHVLPNGSIDVANGTYYDTVVKTNDGWRISKRTLRLITFLNLASPSTSNTR